MYFGGGVGAVMVVMMFAAAQFCECDFWRWGSSTSSVHVIRTKSFRIFIMICDLGKEL